MKSVAIFTLCIFSVAFRPEFARATVPESLETRELLSPDSKKSQPLVFSKVTKPTVYFFWASWCEFCKKFARSHGAFLLSKQPKLDVVMINADEDVSKGIAAAPNYRFGSRQLYMIPSPKTSQFVTILPLLVIVDRAGKVDTVYEGAQADKVGYLKKRLSVLLDEQGVEL